MMPDHKTRVRTAGDAIVSVGGKLSQFRFIVESGLRARDPGASSRDAEAAIGAALENVERIQR